MIVIRCIITLAVEAISVTINASAMLESAEMGEYGLQCLSASLVFLAERVYAYAHSSLRRTSLCQLSVASWRLAVRVACRLSS
jgi:hypothetical protein